MYYAIVGSGKAVPLDYDFSSVGVVRIFYQFN